MWGNRRFAPHAFYGRDRLAAVSAFFLLAKSRSLRFSQPPYSPAWHSPAKGAAFAG